MPEPTPLHARTSAHCSSYQWKEWAGYASVCAYEAHSESEYFALRTSAGILDVSPLHKLDLRGPDGARLLSRVFTRDVTRLREGRVTYGALVNEDGWILDDGTVLRLGAEHWRLSSSEPWGAWLLTLRGNLNVVLEDTSRELAVIAVQGPNARRVVAASGDATLERLRAGRGRSTLERARHHHTRRRAPLRQRSRPQTTLLRRMRSSMPSRRARRRRPRRMHLLTLRQLSDDRGRLAERPCCAGRPAPRRDGI